MEGVAICCRTCDRPPARVHLSGVRLVAYCAACADRTPLRCPSCRRVLSAEDPTSATCCERPWTVRGDRIFDARGPVPDAPPAVEPPPAEAEPAPRARPRRAASKGRLSTHLATTATPSGYRDALYSQVLELERRAFKKLPPVREPAPLSRSPVRIASIGAAVLGLGLALVIGGAAAALAVACVIAPLALFAFAAWRLFYGTPEGLVRVPAQSFRITPERVEIGGEGGWQLLARPSELSGVTRESAEEGVRIRVEVGPDRSVAVLDHLSEEEAVLAEQQIEAQLARVRS